MSPNEIRILVVEDNPLVLDGTARLLEKAGYTVDRAASGEAALQAVQHHPPGLVLLDRDLPGMDGLAVCRRLKRELATAEILVVIVSAVYAESDEQAEGLEAGADGYITRPIPNRELLGRVGAYVRILRLARSLRLETQELKQQKEAARQARIFSSNLMAEAVAARQRLETLNRELQKQIADQKRAEKQLAESELRFRTLIEQAPIAIGIVRDGAGVYGNQKAAQMLGLPDAQAWVGRPVLECFAPQCREESSERTRRRALGLPVPAEFEAIALRPDGSQFPIHVAVAQVQLPDGLADIFFINDVTERQRAEEAVRESEERYRLLFDASPDGIVLIGSDGLIKSANRAQCRMFRYDSLAEMVGLSPVLLIVPARREFAAGIICRRLREEIIPPVEYRLLRKDGTEFWGETSATVLRNADGSITGYICVVRDTTEHKRAEAALVESEERFRGLFETAVVGFYRTTPDGRILMANCALLKMLGYASLEDLAQRDLEQEGFAPDYPRAAFIEQVERDGQVTGFESAWKRRDGRVVFVSENCRALRDQAGRTLFYDGSVEDITERKQAEEALQELTARLLQAQTEERRQIARELHDTTIQSLAALSINLSLLQDAAPELSARAKELLADSLALAERCTQETRASSYLLYPPLLEELGLAGAIRDYADGFARRSGLRIDLELPPDLVRLPRDSELALFRVLQESLSNIHRHSGSKTASIVVTQTTGQIRLEVRDQGRGLGSAPAPPAGASLARGPGVGIAGMRERMLQLEGQLEIQSSEQGTRVIATLARKPQTSAR